MTFYLTCSQGHQRSAVMDVTVVPVVPVVQVIGSASTNSIAYCARLDLCVAAGGKAYVLNMLQYDSDSITYFFIVLTPCKWIVFTVTQ